DENRTGNFVPDGSFGGAFGANIVGTGSDGSAYWNLFNIEGESSILPAFVTYDTLDDMLNDENRTGNFVPDGSFGGAFGANIVGTGSLFVADGPGPVDVPEPSFSWMVMLAMAAAWWMRIKNRGARIRKRMDKLRGRLTDLGDVDTRPGVVACGDLTGARESNEAAAQSYEWSECRCV
ncbi:MAG: hypothetical protein ACU85E_15495, partial [Gammaproteobacteria bacterium]